MFEVVEEKNTDNVSPLSAAVQGKPFDSAGDKSVDSVGNEPFDSAGGEGIREAVGYGQRSFPVSPRILGGFFCIACGFLAMVGAWTLLSHEPFISPIAVAGNEEAVVQTTVSGESVPKSTTANFPPSAYFPKTLTPQFEASIDGVTALAFAAMDRDSGELLLAKNFTIKRPIASITKVMTAIVSLENASLASELLATEEATRTGEASMGLTAGERLTIDELLYGLLLPSGNDAAETLAEGVFLGKDKTGGSEDLPESTVGDARFAARTTFIARMNEKAQELGMYDTRYVNPTGLDENSIETSTYSTALDLLALGNYVLTSEPLVKISGTKFMVIPYKKGYHKAFFLNNILGLRQSYPGVTGIKPGNTDFARETLLSYAENGGKRVVLVLLGSDRTRDDAVKIYDYLFNKLGVKVASKK